MRNARPALVSMLFLAALVLALPLISYSQNREKFVVSAKAGGVNSVTGGASMRHGNTEWSQLTIKEDLEAGDVVKTGVDGRVEMLLNPGSYMRIGENAEFELADNSLENLEVRLIRGTAIVEVTGDDDEELFIGITTPHTRMSIVRRGLYRVSVVPGDNTELIVRKGRVMLEGSHTKVKGGNKVVFSSNSFSVAKLEDADKKVADALDIWSKDRSKMLAKENSRISDRTLNTLASSFGSGWFGSSFFLPRRSGFWFRSGGSCFTFVPYYGRFGSPYGGGYSRSFFIGGFGGWGARQGFGGPNRAGGYGSSQGPTGNRPTSGGRTGGSDRPGGYGNSPGPTANRPPSEGRTSGPNPPMTNRQPERTIERVPRHQ